MRKILRELAIYLGFVAAGLTIAVLGLIADGVLARLFPWSAP